MSLYDELKKLEGTELGYGDWLTISQERIDAFADATGDHQWIHVDQPRASAGPFGSTIAHGYLLVSLIPYLATVLPMEADMKVNYGLNRVRFISPVRTGSEVRSQRKLLEVTEVANGVQIVMLVTIELKGSPKPACVAETVTRLV